MGMIFINYFGGGWLGSWFFGGVLHALAALRWRLVIGWAG